MGASDLSGRVLASLGKGGPVDSHFEACADVPKGGVLLALPALLASGLWERTEEHFELPQGYYQMVHVFLLVALLAVGTCSFAGGVALLRSGRMGQGLGAGSSARGADVAQQIAATGSARKGGGTGRIHLHLGRRTNRPGFRSIAASEVRRRAG